VAGAEFALEALTGDVLAQARRPESLLAAGIRWTTTIVLFPVRFLVTAETAHRLTSNVRDTLDTPLPAGPERSGALGGPPAGPLISADRRLGLQIPGLAIAA
jgi:hypothetical protein